MRGFGMRVGRLFLAALALAATAGPAPATMINETFDFQAAAGGPTPSHAGSFAFSYDSITGASVLTMIDFTIGMTPFSTFNASVAPHAFHSTRPQFILGGIAPLNAEALIEHNTDDFWLIFRPDVGIASHFAYSQAGAGYYFSETPKLATAAAVPEPAAWLLFLLASGAFALIRRPRQPVAAAPC